MTNTVCYRILVAIETDATRYHGSGARQPSLLGSRDTDQLLAHLATDLAAVVPAASSCALAAPGALLDQTQVLRPGYPAFRALEDLTLTDDAHRPGARTGISASEGRIVPDALRPEPDIPLGILQLLPLLVSGPRATITALGEEMEHRFLEKGQVSPHTARWLESAFDVTARHARFMTLTDLNAMFRLQLEHFGFLTLWELIDAALSERSGPLEVKSSAGQVFVWQGTAVETEFQTFDYWANSGLGCKVESARGKLAGGYADWTRHMRQYLSMLSAHAVPVRFHLPGNRDERLENSYLAEAGAHPPPANSAAVTEHSFSELGTVCVTAVRNGHQEHYYPLTAAGMNDIHQAIAARGLNGGAIAYPGSILYDVARRTLVPERYDPAPGARSP